MKTRTSPVMNLEQHLAGKPGHCVSYSGIAANALLSVGVPARMLQVLPKHKWGHNIIEVWDEKAGWVLFDPLSDSLLSKDGDYLSAVEANTIHSEIKRIKADPTKTSPGHLNSYYEGRNPFDGTIIYVEPWLHSRTGKKQSSFYRGSFAAFGEWDATLGPAQDALKIRIILCIVLGSLMALSILWTLLNRRTFGRDQ